MQKMTKKKNSVYGKMMVILFLGLVLLATTPVLAGEVETGVFGITFVSKHQPNVVDKGRRANYEITLSYNTFVKGYPIPIICSIGAEIPRNVYDKPSKGNFVMKAGQVTRTICWQYYEDKKISGTDSMEITFSVLANGKIGASGKTNLGTGKPSGYVLNTKNYTEPIKILVND